jgi:SAM-dependent methyltransferase
VTIESVVEYPARRLGRCLNRSNLHVISAGYFFPATAQQLGRQIVTIRHRMERIVSVYRSEGFRGFATKSVNHMRKRLGVLSAYQKAYYAKKEAVDRAFDLRGVDTGGIQDLHDLTIKSENARYGIAHIACDPSEFAAAIKDVPGNLSEYAFVDFGSGKGRALLMAAELPFRRIVGVEFAAELYATAVKNCQSRPIELVHGDATQYALPVVPLVLYLFNPFDAPIVAEVARRAMTSWRLNPRPMIVVYVNPLHAGEWINAGWREISRGAAHAIFAPHVAAC